MPKFNFKNLTATMSIMALCGFLGIFFYINLISPLAGDTWKLYALNGLDGNKPVINLFKQYYHGYHHQNPRIGQIALQFAGYGQIFTAIISTASLLVLFISGTYLVTGKLFQPKKYQDIILFAVFIAITVKIGRRVGVVFFYTPFTTNYMFALAVLISFLAIVRYYQDEAISNLLNKIKFPLIIFMGFMAGMSNEHTIPPFLGLGLLWLIWNAVSKKKFDSTFIFNSVAYLSLLIGYLALYFAPGQNKRYGNVKNEGFEALTSNLPDQIIKVLKLASSGSWQLVIILIFGLIMCYYLKKYQNKNIFWQTVLFIGAIGIIFVTMASPKVGHRLIFASYAIIGFCYVGLLHNLRQHKALYLPLGIISIIVTFNYMNASFTAYKKYSYAFKEQAYKIERLKRQGQTDLILEPLNFDFKKYSEFTRKDRYSEDPKHAYNRYRARIYGVKTISYRSNKKTRSK